MSSMEVVLVTGDREWKDVAALREALSRFAPGTWLVHGGCRGADEIAHNLALSLGLQPIRMDALWSAHGRSAGPRRNREMGRLVANLRNIGFKAHALVCHDDLENSRGTADMVKVLEYHDLSWTRLKSREASNV